MSEFYISPHGVLPRISDQILEGIRYKNLEITKYTKSCIRQFIKEDPYFFAANVAMAEEISKNFFPNDTKKQQQLIKETVKIFSLVRKIYEIALECEILEGTQP